MKSPKYIGSFPIEVATHPVFSNYTKSDWAMYFIEGYGQIDGGHHKQWVLDQVARCLMGVPIIVEEARWDNGHSEYRIHTGNPNHEYEVWVETMRGKYNEEDEEYEFDYDEGVAP